MLSSRAIGLIVWLKLRNMKDQLSQASEDVANILVLYHTCPSRYEDSLLECEYYCLCDIIPSNLTDHCYANAYRLSLLGVISIQNRIVSEEIKFQERNRV